MLPLGSARVSLKPIGYVATMEPFHEHPAHKTRSRHHRSFCSVDLVIQRATYSCAGFAATVFKIDDGDDLMGIVSVLCDQTRLPDPRERIRPALATTPTVIIGHASCAGKGSLLVGCED